MPAVKPEWQSLWEFPITDIRARLARNTTHFVGQGIGGPSGTWATYIRKPNGSLKRVVSKYLPERKTKEDAERDLYVWFWHM